MTENHILSFLTELSVNNDRDWLLAHKDLQKAAVAEFEQFLAEIIAGLAPADPSIAFLDPKPLMYKLNRDTRFSADKSPYNPSLRAHISPGGHMPIPGKYYIRLAPGGSFLGGGVHAEPFPAATGMIRDHICAHGQAFERILEEPFFKNNFTLTGAQLKKVPQGYDPDHPQGRYLQYKSWDIEYPIPDERLGDLGALSKEAVEIFKRMQPFNEFLNAALTDFRFPERPRK